MVLFFDDVLLVYLGYKLVLEPAKKFGDRFTAEVNRNYLRACQAQLREVRLLYERKEISEEDYKKLSAYLRAAIQATREEIRRLMEEG